MAPSPLLARHGLQLCWALFAATVLGLFGWAVKVHRAAPYPAPVRGEPDGAGVRFGLTEAARRAHFVELVRGEPNDRQRAEKVKEYWSHNHDDFFHEYEAGRIERVSRARKLPLWQAYLILDEGLRGHWTPPPGVEVRADDGPLVFKAQPLAKRRLIAAGRPLPPKPAATAPAPAVPPPLRRLQVPALKTDLPALKTGLPAGAPKP